MPPEYCVKARKEPIIALKRRIRVRPPSAKTSTTASIEPTSPRNGWKPARIVCPIQIPTNSETKTCRV